MLTQNTIEKLRQMRLSSLAEAFKAQLQDPQISELSFGERFGLLVDHEWPARQSRRLERLLKSAELRVQACPEDVDYRQPRALDRSQLRSLFTCSFIQEHHNVIITGPTGVGKTFTAYAPGNAACRKGFTVLYYRISRLLSDLTMSKGDGSYPRLLSRLARLDLLILDDWGLAPLSANSSREILEIIDDRSLRSTVIASQLPRENWHSAMGDPTVADAILDRLVHNSYKILLRGESMRKVINKQMSNTLKDHS